LEKELESYKQFKILHTFESFELKEKIIELKEKIIELEDDITDLQVGVTELNQEMDFWKLKSQKAEDDLKEMKRMGFSHSTFQYLEKNLSPLINPFVDSTYVPLYLWILFVVQMAVNFFKFVKVDPLLFCLLIFVSLSLLRVPFIDL